MQQVGPSAWRTGGKRSKNVPPREESQMFQKGGLFQDKVFRRYSGGRRTGEDPPARLLLPGGPSRPQGQQEQVIARSGREDNGAPRAAAFLTAVVSFLGGAIGRGIAIDADGNATAVRPSASRPTRSSPTADRAPGVLTSGELFIGPGISPELPRLPRRRGPARTEPRHSHPQAATALSPVPGSRALATC